MERDRIRTDVIPDCGLCGGPGGALYDGLTDRLYQVPGTWRYDRCRDCGFVWLNPRPVPEDLDKIYGEGYFSHKETDFAGIAASPRKERIKALVLSGRFGYGHLARRTILTALFGRLMTVPPFIKRKVTLGLGALLLPFREGGRLLDIGCGNGGYLALMQALGWEVAGIETDPVAADLARSSLGAPVHTGTIDDAPMEKASFDAVTVVHVLEHVADPADFLGRAAGFLKPGGRLVAVMPNIGSLGHRLFREDWYHLDPPRHFSAFSPRTLARCAVKAGGLRIERIQTAAAKSGKTFNKYKLVKKTGRFSDPSEKALNRTAGVTWPRRLFCLIESMGNPFFKWGEEIECILIKD
jgi:2-polyprenyl-3-methyl-5-hydroxy-6-metoxy-1,4-benzoquinol methylase